MNKNEFDRYSQKHIHFFTDDIPPLLERLLIGLPDNFVMADLGCGDGALLFALNQRGYFDKARRVIGIDLSEDRINNLQSISPKIEGICSDVCQIDRLPDQSVDLVISSQVIEHILGDIKFLKEIKRLLKEKGKFYISTVIKRKYAVYFYRRNGKFILDPTHVKEYQSIKELKEIFSEVMLKIDKWQISQIYFPLLDLFFRFLIIIGLVRKVDSLRMIYIHSNLLKSLRDYLKIPVLGYKWVEVIGHK